MATPQLAESSCLFLLEREKRGENETKGYDTLCIYGFRRGLDETDGRSGERVCIITLCTIFLDS